MNEARRNYTATTGMSFPPLCRKDEWIAAMKLANPFLRDFEIEKEWQQRRGDLYSLPIITIPHVVSVSYQVE